MTYTFSNFRLIPEKIQNWICNQPEYPKATPKGSTYSLGNMALLTLETINEIVNARYDECEPRIMMDETTINPCNV
jgi:hypothetical protein